MRIAVLLLHPVWSFDLNAAIQIFDDSSRPQNAPAITLDFVSPGTSMPLDHGMSITTVPLAEYTSDMHPDLIVLCRDSPIRSSSPRTVGPETTRRHCSATIPRTRSPRATG